MREPQKQELLNELRTEILNYRAVRLNRWLQVLGFILTFFAIALPVAGYLGYQEFRNLETEAKKLTGEVETARNEVETILGKVEAAEAKLRSQTEVLGTVEQKVNQLEGTTEAVVAATQFLTILSDRGFEPFNTRLGELGSMNSKPEAFSLSPGRYRFTADCDSNCADLDLFLYRPDNEEPLAEDLLLDAYPIVEYEVRDEPEDVIVEVLMVECSEESCDWELTAYRD